MQLGLSHSLLYPFCSICSLSTILEQKYSLSFLHYEYYLGCLYFPYRHSSVQWREDPEPPRFFGPRRFGTRFFFSHPFPSMYP